MSLPARIITTKGALLHVFAVTTASPGMDRATICQAEKQAKEWAAANGHKVVSDIVSQGAYRAWVEPISPGRIRAMQQLGRMA